MLHHLFEVLNAQLEDLQTTLDEDMRGLLIEACEFNLDYATGIGGCSVVHGIA
jgi:hypothetical protein